MMCYVDDKRFLWFPVDNKYFSSCLYHGITQLGYIIKRLSYITYIDDVDSHTPYFDIFVLSSCSMPEEVRNITT